MGGVYYCKTGGVLYYIIGWRSLYTGGLVLYFSASVFELMSQRLQHVLECSPYYICVITKTVFACYERLKLLNNLEKFIQCCAVKITLKLIPEKILFYFLNVLFSFS